MDRPHLFTKREFTTNTTRSCALIEHRTRHYVKVCFGFEFPCLCNNAESKRYPQISLVCKYDGVNCFHSPHHSVARNQLTTNAVLCTKVACAGTESASFEALHNSRLLELWLFGYGFDPPPLPERTNSCGHIVMVECNGSRVHNFTPRIFRARAGIWDLFVWRSSRHLLRNCRHIFVFFFYNVKFIYYILYVLA